MAGFDMVEALLPSKFIQLFDWNVAANPVPSIFGWSLLGWGFLFADLTETVRTASLE